MIKPKATDTQKSVMNRRTWPRHQLVHVEKSCGEAESIFFYDQDLSVFHMCSCLCSFVPLFLILDWPAQVVRTERRAATLQVNPCTSAHAKCLIGGGTAKRFRAKLKTLHLMQRALLQDVDMLHSSG